ncbi:N-acyl homoserine lactonase family protein [[Eubacterium] cellulosolvens]
MDWKIHVLYVGDIICPKGVSTFGLDTDLKLKTPYLAFLLVSKSKKILVDTGMNSRFIIDGKAWAGLPAKGGEKFLLESLKKKNTQPEDIETVVYTHLHNDHAGNCHLFPNALHVFHYDEWTELQTPLPSMRIRKDFDPDVIPYLKKFRCLKVTGDTILTDGINLYHTPGHTIGGLTIGVNTSGGVYVIPGDIINIYQNLFSKMSSMVDLTGKRYKITPAPEEYGPLGVPSTILYDHYAWYRSIWKIRGLIKSPKHLLPCHESAICGKTFPGDSIDLDIPE